MKWEHAAAALVVTGLLVLAGCGTVEPARKANAKPRYDEIVAKRVAAASDKTTFHLRYNPATCGCPPYEIALGGVWQRVALDVSDEPDPVVTLLRAATTRDQKAGRLGIYTLQGELEDALATCARGTIYVTFRPTAFGPPPPSGSPPPSSGSSSGSSAAPASS